MSLPFGNNNNANSMLNSLAATFLSQSSGSLTSDFSHLLNPNLFTNALQTQIASQSLTYTNQTYMNTLIPMDPLGSLGGVHNQKSLLGPAPLPAPLPVPVPTPFPTQSMTATTTNPIVGSTFTSSTFSQPLAPLPSIEQSNTDLPRHSNDSSRPQLWNKQNPVETETSNQRPSNSGDGLLGSPPGGVKKQPSSKPKPKVYELPSQTHVEPPMVLTSATAKHASMHKVRNSIHSRETWHKFTILQGADMDKEKVLKRILDFVLPTFMIPCLYQTEGEDSFFLARNCGNSVDRLCQRKLLIPPDSHFQQVIQLWITLEYATSSDIRINTSVILTHTLKKRLDEDQCLNLADYYHDPDMERLMFFPLSQPIIMHYVLSAAVARLSNVSAIDLSKNQLRTLKSLEVLMKMSTLRSLDLRDNELLYKSDLEDLKVLSQLTSLSLDGNPLCAEFKTPREYISYARTILPNLEVVDGVTLCCGSITQQNYFPVEKSVGLADQFLRHYFNRYDWENRQVLDGLYHQDVLISMTCAIVPSKIASQSLAPYSAHNRNLLCLSDFSQVEKRLYKGQAAVLDFLCSLPPTSHDQYSFRVDVLQFSDMQATLSVQGVFKELSGDDSKGHPIRSFNRIFVIAAVGRNEWQIINEIVHISNATEKQVATAFMYKKPPLEEPTKTSIWQDADMLKDSDKSRLVTTLVQLSTMNIQWAIRYLKEAKWNLREALITFVEHYESEKVPAQAFLSDKT